MSPQMNECVVECDDVFLFLNMLFYIVAHSLKFTVACILVTVNHYVWLQLCMVKLQCFKIWMYFPIVGFPVLYISFA